MFTVMGLLKGKSACFSASSFEGGSLDPRKEIDIYTTKGL